MNKLRELIEAKLNANYGPDKDGHLMPKDDELDNVFRVLLAYDAALEFYADRSNWQSDVVPHIHSFIDDMEKESTGTFADQHGGKLAREARQAAMKVMGI